MTTYRVRYERDGTHRWVASVREVRGCHTQGRTIEEARRRIREALSLFVADADSAEVVEEVRLPRQARIALTRFRATQRRAHQEVARGGAAAKEVARLLTKKMHLSVRDAGNLMGLSHQRVQQLLQRG